jgi:hypothetical protein
VSFFYTDMTNPANPPSPSAGGEAAGPSTGQEGAAHESARPRPQVLHEDTPPQGAGGGGEVAGEATSQKQKEGAQESAGPQGDQDETPPQGAGGGEAASEAI